MTRKSTVAIMTPFAPLRRLMGMLAKMAKADGKGDESLQNCPQWR